MNHHLTLLSLLVFWVGINLKVDAERVVPGKKYHFDNPDFPRKYKPNVADSWDLDTHFPVKLMCFIFDVPYSPGCTNEVFIIDDGTDRTKYCGGTAFNRTTAGNRQVSFSYYASNDAQGGTFACEFQTTQKLCTSVEYFYDRLSGRLPICVPNQVIY